MGMSYKKPNLDALGKNREDAYFSSVRWGGVNDSNLGNFTKTVSGPCPHAGFSPNRLQFIAGLSPPLRPLRPV